MLNIIPCLSSYLDIVERHGVRRVGEPGEAEEEEAQHVGRGEEEEAQYVGRGEEEEAQHVGPGEEEEAQYVGRGEEEPQPTSEYFIYCS